MGNAFSHTQGTNFVGVQLYPLALLQEWDSARFSNESKQQKHLATDAIQAIPLEADDSCSGQSSHSQWHGSL